MPEQYDAIIIGAGPNGLACGCYLAKAGLKVLCVDRLRVVGGGATTEEVTAPGFKHNLHSLFHGWIHMGPVYKELELEKYGSRYVFPEQQRSIVLSRGDGMIGYLDLDKTCAGIARFSKRDADTFREIAIRFRTFVQNVVIPAFFSPPIPVWASMAAMGETPDSREFIKWQLSTPKAVLDDLFECEELKAWLLFEIFDFSVTHDMLGAGLFIPLLIAEMHRPFGYGVAIGGSRTLGEGMTRMLEAHGGKVLLNSHVQKILIKDGTAYGVRLEDGTEIKTNKIVVSSLEPKQTFLKLVGEEHLPSGAVRDAKRWQFEEFGIVNFHTALHESPRFKAAEVVPDLNRCHRLKFLDNVQQLEDNLADIRRGLPPEDPCLSIGIPTLFDPTQAPPGKHTIYFWTFGPYHLRDGGPEAWDKIKHDYAELCFAKLRKYAPNMTRDNIIGMYVHSPLDVERWLISMPQADFNHGKLTQDQMGIFRPSHRYPPYRTAIKNLYLCGSSTHPAGSISAAPGHNAAIVIADDLKLKKWWVK